MVKIPTWKRDIATHRRVGAALRTIRERYELSQTYVANIIGCHSTSISLVELGKAGSMELVESVLWAYGLTMADLKLERATLVSLQRARRIQEAKAKAAKHPKRKLDRFRKAA
jgi:transcriptional regulator with XRE-family HTH domain